MLIVIIHRAGGRGQPGCGAVVVVNCTCAAARGRRQPKTGPCSVESRSQWLTPWHGTRTVSIQRAGNVRCMCSVMVLCSCGGAQALAKRHRHSSALSLCTPHGRGVKPLPGEQRGGAVLVSKRGESHLRAPAQPRAAPSSPLDLTSRKLLKRSATAHRVCTYDPFPRIVHTWLLTYVHG